MSGNGKANEQMIPGVVSAAAVWWSSTSCLIVSVAVPSKKLVVGNQTGDCAHFSQFRGECDNLFARECCLDEHTLLFDLLEVRHFLHVEQMPLYPFDADGATEVLVGRLTPAPQIKSAVFKSRCAHSLKMLGSIFG